MEVKPDLRAVLEREAQRAAETIRRGGLIVYPTDTIWGIGCDASRADAVRRVFELKKRAESKSLIVLVDSEDRLLRTVREVPFPA